MMPQPSTAPEPEGWDPEEEDHSPCPQDLGDEEYSAGPDAASMEGAISKFMEGLQVQERSGFPQIHRLLSRLPVPVQKKSRSMTHAEALEGRYLPNMSEEERKRFTPSELILYKHALEYKWTVEQLKKGVLPSLWWAGSLFCHCIWLVTRLRLSLTCSASARKRASHLAVPTLLLWTDDGAAISTKSTRGCGSLGAASPALGACPSSRLGRGSKSQAMHGTSGQPRQNGLARRLEPDSK